MPISAALLGAFTGAELRSSEVRSSEGQLPVSHGQRMLGSALGALVHAILLALLVLAVSAALSLAWRETVGELLFPKGPGFFSWRNWGVDGWDALAGTWLWLSGFTLAYLVSATLGLAYALGQGVLGGLLGLLLAGGGAGALAFGVALQAVHGFRAQDLGWAAAGLLAAALGAPAALAQPGAWLERGRRRGARAALAAAFLLASGSLLSLTGVGLQVRELRRGLLPDVREGDWGAWATWKSAGTELSPAARRQAAAGALFATREAGLIWVAPDGRRTRLIPDQAPWTGLLEDEYRPMRILGIAWGADGLWVLTRREVPPNDLRSPRAELWHGPPDKPLRLAGTLTRRQPEARGLARLGGRLGVVLQGESFQRLRFAPVESLADERSWVADAGILFDPGPAAGAYAAALKEPRRLEQGEGVQGEGWQGGRSWRLPGDARLANLAPGWRVRQHLRAFPVGGELAFLVPVELDGGHAALAVCRPGGGADPEWSGTLGLPKEVTVLPGGGLWVKDTGDSTLKVVSPSGRFLPPIPLQPAFGRFTGGKAAGLEAVHADEERVWIVLDDRLVELDASDGGVRRAWELPSASREGEPRGRRLKAAADGLFVHDGKRLHFLDWEGRLRDLGPA